jgi:hypothetical protein
MSESNLDVLLNDANARIDVLVTELRETVTWLEEQAQAVERHYGGGIVPARLRGRATVIKQTLFNLENQ